jgi:hypothetical protein
MAGATVTQRAAEAVELQRSGGVVRHKRSRSVTLDAVKALQEKRSKCERNILKLTGASKLAEDQFKQVLGGGRCSLCLFEVAAYLPGAEDRMRRTLALCHGARERYMEQHRDCMAELEVLTGSNQVARSSMHTDEWCSFEYKNGKIATLREQKAHSLRCRACVVCGSNIDNLADFLSAVDRQIMQKESVLHIHKEPQSC